MLAIYSFSAQENLVDFDTKMISNTILCVYVPIIEFLVLPQSDHSCISRFFVLLKILCSKPWNEKKQIFRGYITGICSIHFPCSFRQRFGHYSNPRKRILRSWKSQYTILPRRTYSGVVRVQHLWQHNGYKLWYTSPHRCVGNNRWNECGFFRMPEHDSFGCRAHGYGSFLYDSGLVASVKKVHYRSINGHSFLRWMVTTKKVENSGRSKKMNYRKEATTPSLLKPSTEKTQAIIYRYHLLFYFIL